MFPKKQKKEIKPWRQGILSHHQSKPSSADRGKFSRKVVAELIEEADGKCQCGCGKPDHETHHIWLRSRSGRGVKQNGMRVNSECHKRMHANDDELRHWIEVYRQRHGDYFWFDEQDWFEHNRKVATEKVEEDAKRQRAELLQPVIHALNISLGRNLRRAERRFIEGLNEHQREMFAGLLHDIIGTGVRNTADTTFGYGRFND